MLISRTQLRRSYRQENQLSWVFLEEASQKCGLGTYFTSLSVFQKMIIFLSREVAKQKVTFHGQLDFKVLAFLSS